MTQKAYLHLVKYALDLGHKISIHDGGEFQVKNSKSYKAIKDAIESVDDSEIYIRQPNNDHVGWAYVVLYGNDPEETVSDYGDNGFMDTWNNTYNALLKEQENA